MASNRQLDSLQLDRLDLPYSRIENEIMPVPRLVDGENILCTYGGKLAKRPGTTAVANSTWSGHRIDRLIPYETVETTPRIYLIASGENLTTNVWELAYLNLADVSPAWTQPTEVRQSAHSTRPHELVVARGVVYIKSYPTDASAERLGTTILNCTGGSITHRVWGGLGPTTAARISGVKHILSADITAGATSFAVDSVASFPATPFVIQVDYERMNVTAVVGTTLTVTRAYDGTQADTHDANAPVIFRDWDVSANNVYVYFGWTYSYCYVTATGHYTNRAAKETSPAQLPSFTGPFRNHIPKITVQGHADTTNYPSIAILRTTDGGGTYFVLETITNTGAGSITYLDDSLATNSPVTDDALNTSVNNIAPGTTFNSPPPSTATLGQYTVQPAASTPLVYYAGRIWYAIGNTLFYSGNEEINLGVPEECFPTGSRDGNYYLFKNQINNLIATPNALYVLTSNDCYVITGTNRETFQVRIYLAGFGAPVNHPRAVASRGDVPIWLTQDYRVVVMDRSGGEDRFSEKVITDPLADSLTTEVAASREVTISHFSDQEKDWLVVATIDKDTPSDTKLFIYDTVKTRQTKDDFWNVPWTLSTSAILAAKYRTSDLRRRLVTAAFDGTNTCLAYFDVDTSPGTDYDIATTSNVGFADSLTTSLIRVPPGDHVNMLRIPNLTPVIYNFILERTDFPRDADPTVEYFTDDLWTRPYPAMPGVQPPRRYSSKGYRTLMYHMNIVGHRTALKISHPVTRDRFELLGITFGYLPDGGA